VGIERIGEIKMKMQFLGMVVPALFAIGGVEGIRTHKDFCED
jgi:hypothetical protein